MKTKATENVKLGMFVLAGLLFLIFTLYMIGKNRNLFGSTFTIKAAMETVNGLTPGSNVRFKGLDIGTVRRIELEDDGTIYVVMIIDKKMTRYIKQNAVASVGTDGLMGNKLVNISPIPGEAPQVMEGSVIRSREAVETDEMLRTLNTTNNTIERVAHNLNEITMKLNTSKSLWNLLSDSILTAELKAGVTNFREAAAHTSALTNNAKDMFKRFSDGRGIANSIFTDTTLAGRLDESMIQIQAASERTSAMIKSLESVIRDMRAGEGTAGLLLTDTALRHTLMQSANNLEEGTARFSENMEALKSNFLFRRYFKKREKERAHQLKEKREADAITRKNEKPKE